MRAYAIVDARDAHHAERRWALHSAGYAYYLDRDRHAVYLHREILGIKYGDPIEVDHINRDRLDCRRGNLRAGTTAANRQNVSSRGGASASRGVYFDRRRGKWYAQVKSQGVRHHCGTFATEAEAIEAAKAARARLLPYSVG